MDEVLTRALVRKPEPIEWDEEKAKADRGSVTTERRSRRRALV